MSKKCHALIKPVLKTSFGISRNSTRKQGQIRYVYNVHNYFLSTEVNPTYNITKHPIYIPTCTRMSKSFKKF